MSLETNLIKLINTINTESQFTIKRMAGGNCNDFAEYQKQCGYVAGLNKAIELINQLIEQANEDNDA